jgi:hypothetical protein
MVKGNSYLIFLFLLPILTYWLLNIFFIDENNEVNIVYWLLNVPSIAFSLICFFKSDFLVKNSIQNNFFHPLFILYIVSFFYTLFTHANVTVTSLLQYAITFPILYSSFSLGFNFQKKPNQKRIIVLISKIFIILAFVMVINSLIEYGFLTLLQRRPFTYSFYFICILAYFIVSNKSENKFNKIFFILLSIVVAFFSGSRSCLILILVLSIVYVIRMNLFLLSILIILILLNYNYLLDFIDQTRFNSGESSSRILIWENVINQINTNKNYFFGNGFIRGNFITFSGNYSVAHNTYLQMFYSYGLVGIVLSFSSFYFFFKNLYKEHILLFICFFLLSLSNDLPLLTYEWSRISEAMIFFFFFGSIFQTNESKNFNTI